MLETPLLRPASRDEIADTLSFALHFNGRKRLHDADEMVARITLIGRLSTWSNLALW